MTQRWIGAAAAALALGVLTLPNVPAWQGATTVSAACQSDVQPKIARLDYTLKDMSGKDVHLASYKGKVILLDFWATWCGPCKVEIPILVDLQTRYRDKGLVVLGVSVDDPIEKLKPFAAQFKVNYPLLVGLGRDDFQDAFSPMFAVPVTFVIGRDGKVCTRHTGMQENAQKTRERFEREIKGLL